MAPGICEGMRFSRVKRIEYSNPTNMLHHNLSAISIVKNPLHYDRTKHVEIDQHLIKEKVEQVITNVIYISPNQQTVDILIKAVQRKNLEDLSSKLDMINIYA